jgi:glycosyltransferase involved in cell wall biosynthesis
MLFSIIIPLYNKAQYIQYTIQSVLNQTYQNFEIIVIDDGSQDDGPALVRAIDDPRIRCITQKNGGVSRARNHGVSIAQGDVICFLDADDWYLPEYLQTVASMAGQYPKHQVFATGFQRVHGLSPEKLNSGLPDLGKREIVENMFARIVGRDHILHICSVAVRRTYLQSLQPCFPEGEQMGEDLDLLFRLASKNPIVYCPAPLFGYRQEVVSSLCATNRVITVLPVFRRLEERAQDSSLPLTVRFSMLACAADARITISRRRLVLGEWRQALQGLIGARYGMVRHRWWITLIMCFFPMPNLTLRWQRWRDSPDRRTQL